MVYPELVQSGAVQLQYKPSPHGLSLTALLEKK